ncbi:protein of unknown function [Methylacidimicrobium sp. AP8]|uniref:AbrB/MazE/SpoVT family DNA-binding domain-containing protein n=1 Tax=Methylacidimicrobium sp. AP8 TaxID=2730359 RepID=UPI0018C19F01|nr:AbrB/MazE/SpoVT family DNA-binding domain-containing protein [Methylacidimicrobium sp. AP8]CAB4244125.1 protein of unknown function [Methylacidimicrobium sp. AP8]
MSVAPDPEGNSHSSQAGSIPSESEKAAAAQKNDAESAAGEAKPTCWTTHLSTKGQVVIPEQIRKDFGMRPGDEFVVVALNDLIFLKRV